MKRASFLAVAALAALALGAGPPAGSGSGSGSPDAPAKRPEREPPAQPVTAAAFSYPYVYSERFAATGDVPATALLKVQDRGVTAYVRNAKGDDSYGSTDLKLDTKSSRIAYGVTPAFHLKGGFRLAFGLDSEEWEAKSTVGGAVTGKARQSWDLTTFSLQGAMRVQGPWAVGLKYSSSRLSLLGDARGTGGRLTADDERFADIRPSAALIHAADEVHFEFLPKISYRAGAAEFARPATPAVHYRRTLAPGRVAFANAAYGLWAGTGKDRASAPALSGGYVTSQPRWGDVGGSLGYRAKHYAAAAAATPESIARFEGSLFADIRPDRDTHYALSVDGSLGQDRGESPGGNGAAIRAQELTYQLAFARLF